MNKGKFISFTASLVLAMVFTFSCSSPDDGGSVSYGSVTYGGQSYKTVKIGNQIWMAENLNYNASGSKCYDTSPSNCDIYGRLYSWSAAMGFSSNCDSNICTSQIQQLHRGICPSGWHIPSDADWDELFLYVDNENGGDGESYENAYNRLLRKIILRPSLSYTERRSY